MPHLVGLFSHPDSFDLLVSVFAVEQTKLYTRRVFRKQREVYTRSVPGGSQRIRIARPYFHQNLRLVLCPRQFHVQGLHLTSKMNPKLCIVRIFRTNKR